ncbi:hypothetical protein Cus16_0833 [Curtobacterium sp. ER1/6]|nr:hypothetical protein Cus16_0833 [Curtobacterium sp. ER1/6]
MRGDERGGGGALRQATDLPPVEQVVDPVVPSDAVPAGEGVEFEQQPQDREALAVEGDRDTVLERDHDLVGVGGLGRVLRPRPVVRGGTGPGVVRRRRRDEPAPQVLLGPRGRDGTRRHGDDVEVGVEPADRGGQGHLVRGDGGVGDRSRAELPGGAYQMGRDEGAAECRYEHPVAVARVRTDRRDDVLLRELGLGVDDDGVRRTRCAGTVADGVDLARPPADVDHEGQDLVVATELPDGGRRVDAGGAGHHDAIGHGLVPGPLRRRAGRAPLAHPWRSPRGARRAGPSARAVGSPPRPR